MAKSWRPRKNEFGFSSFSNPYGFNKEPRQPKEEPQPHIMTSYERRLIEELTPVINNKQLIKFWYEDTSKDVEDWRIVEPHLIGQTKFKHANILLVGWFLPTANQRLIGHEEKWGNYILDGVQKLEILPQYYSGSRQLYNKNDKRMKTIFCATSY